MVCRIDASCISRDKHQRNQDDVCTHQQTVYYLLHSVFLAHNPLRAYLPWLHAASATYAKGCPVTCRLNINGIFPDTQKRKHNTLSLYIRRIILACCMHNTYIFESPSLHVLCTMQAHQDYHVASISIVAQGYSVYMRALRTY